MHGRASAAVAAQADEQGVWLEASRQNARARHITTTTATRPPPTPHREQEPLDFTHMRRVPVLLEPSSTGRVQ